MANTGKTIKQFSLLTKLNNTDGVLVQRNNEYFYVNAKSLASGAEISDTYANIASLISGNNLERGATYYVSDKYVWLFAIDDDKFSLNGSYFARNADYQSNGVYAGITVANGFTVNATGTNLGIWTSALAPASGDVSIWNGLHYLNITGANGASNPPADATNWELVANTDIAVANTYGYIFEYDAIEYDFANDTINRRVDLRGNDIGGNESIFQWGNDKITNNTSAKGCDVGILNLIIGTSFYSNSYIGIGSWNWGDGNVVDKFYGNTVMAQITTTTTNASMAMFNNLFSYQSSIEFEVFYSALTNFNFNQVQHQNASKSGILTINPVSQHSGQCAVGNSNIFGIDIELTATAYAGGTTYTYGDFATNGTVTYMYINSTDTAGNAPPNATYWVEVFDVTTAGRHKLTISKYFEMYGELNLVSSSATETIDEIVFSDGYVNPLKFSCETGLAVTFDNTAYASLANEGEILSSANIVVDGDKEEFAVFDQVDVGGTDYIREIYSQTAIA